MMRVDGTVGVLAVAALLVEGAIRDPVGVAQPAEWVGAAVVGAALTVRRRAPLASTVGTIAGILLCLKLFACSDSAIAIVVVSVATVSYLGDRRRAVAVALALTPITVLILFAVSHHLQPIEFFVHFLLVLGAVAVGDALRARTQAAVATQARRQLERTAETRRLIDAERLRLAREVHDTVAHALVAINTRAGVAAHLYTRDPGQAMDALTDIKIASAQALAELRETLTTLHQDNDGTTTAVGQTLAAIPELVARNQSDLWKIELNLPAPLPALTPSADHAAYRIVQESVTNALRHSTGTVVRIDVTVRDAFVDISTFDNGSHAAKAEAPVSGHGLVGMAERAAAVGGYLTAGPTAGHGWRVHAVIPTRVDG